QSKASSLNDKIKTLVINASSIDDPIFEKSAMFELCADFIAFRPEHVPPEGSERDKFIFNLTYTIRTSISCGRFVGAVVLDKDDRYLGSFGKSFFSEASALWASWSPSAVDKASIANRVLSTTVFGAALLYPRQRVATIEGFVAAVGVDATVAAAYARLSELN